MKIRIRNIFPIILVLALLFAIPILVLAEQSIPAKPQNNIPVCGKTTKGEARCHSRIIVGEKGKPSTSSVPNGYGPADFLKAYNQTGNATTNRIIAIVDAYDHPKIFSDLTKYSNQYGINPVISNCNVNQGTTANPCFQKVDQNGGTNYPRKNPNWDVEISLDVEIARAMCHNCNILLVEANSNSLQNLAIAFQTAYNMGANVISNSYGGTEFQGENFYDTYYNKQNIGITFSSGDNGYLDLEYPAASPYVTSVGGTTLIVNPYNETVWSGAGSGCSNYESKPGFQTDPLCSRRTIADVSADANPSTGAAIYDSIPYFGFSGWFKVGGTSLSSPIVAGVYALAGGVTGYGNVVPYSNSQYLNDVTSGSNGNCGGTYLCTAVTGYDGPTGLGTPNSTRAFHS